MREVTTMWKEETDLNFQRDRDLSEKNRGLSTMVKNRLRRKKGCSLEQPGLEEFFSGAERDISKKNPRADIATPKKRNSFEEGLPGTSRRRPGEKLTSSNTQIGQVATAMGLRLQQAIWEK